MTHKLYRTLLLAAAVAVLLAPATARAQSDDAVDDAIDAAGDAIGAAGDAMEALDGLGALDALGKGLYGCSSHQKITLDGKKLDSKKLGTPKTPLFLSASGHCKVTIRNLRVEAVHGFSLSGHAKVVIEDSTIAAGKVAFHISGHAKVSVARSRIDSKLAINASGFAKVELDAKTKVKGKITGGKRTEIVHRKK